LLTVPKKNTPLLYGDTSLVRYIQKGNHPLCSMLIVPYVLQLSTLLSEFVQPGFWQQFFYVHFSTADTETESYSVHCSLGRHKKIEM
jgi:hypothetical protein